MYSPRADDRRLRGLSSINETISVDTPNTEALRTDASYSLYSTDLAIDESHARGPVDRNHESKAAGFM